MSDSTTADEAGSGNWRFFRDPGVTGPMDDPRLALLASCVADQQRFAGFGDCIDIREAKCPKCRAPGFNTGMGFWKHTCGAEVSSDGEDCSGCNVEKSKSNCGSELPPGKTCGDCVYIRRCKAMFGHVEQDAYCDWSPSRFREVNAEQIPKPQKNHDGTPCGECHIQPGETCDICGAVADSIPTVEDTQRPMAAGGHHLSDCPFCGGLAHFQQIEFDEWNENSGGQYIECSACQCCTRLMFACGDDVKPLLAEIWNRKTRADDHVQRSMASNQSSARCTRCGGGACFTLTNLSATAECVWHHASVAAGQVSYELSILRSRRRGFPQGQLPLHKAPKSRNYHISARIYRRQRRPRAAASGTLLGASLSLEKRRVAAALFCSWWRP